MTKAHVRNGAAPGAEPRDAEEASGRDPRGRDSGAGRDPAVRVERHVSIALLFAVGIETAGALVWAGAAGARISQLEAQLARRSEEVQRLARLEAEVGAVRIQLDRIETRLEGRELSAD